MKRKKALRKAEQLLHKALNLVVDARINKAYKKDIRRLRKEGPLFTREHAKTLKPEWGKPFKPNKDFSPKTKAVHDVMEKVRTSWPISKGGRVLRPIDLMWFRLRHHELVEAKDSPSPRELERGYAVRLQVTWLEDNCKKLSKDDLYDAPFFTVFDCWKGQCQAREVPKSWWVVSSINAMPCEEAAVVLEAMALTVHGVEPEKSDEDVSLEGMDVDHIFDDLDAALCYLNNGGTLVKVPDSMNDDEKHWRLYVVGN